MQRATISPAREPRRETSLSKFDPVAGLKAAEGGGGIESGIGQLGPTPKRPPMLNLLRAPASRGLLKARVVGEDPAEVMRVGGAIQFDEARRLDHPHDLGVDLARVEPVPGNIIERPTTHTVHYRVADE